jgi:hypothetical protein
MEESQSAAQAPLPAFRSHKIVYALKIAGIEVRHPQVLDGQGATAFHPATLYFEERFAPLDVDAEWMRTRKPQAGGYWVQYQDGYTSWSPAKAFEDGYTPIADWGPRYLQETKYKVDPATGRLANRYTGQLIPDDEPVMIFRAKDAMAMEALTAYRHAVAAQCEALAPDHSEAGIAAGKALADLLVSVDERIAAFRAFRETHQDRLRNPT